MFARARSCRVLQSRGFVGQVITPQQVESAAEQERPLAALSLIRPIIVVVAMACSSLLVVSNSLRLRR